MADFGLLRSERAPDPGLKGLILAIPPLTQGKSIEHNEKEVIQQREVWVCASFPRICHLFAKQLFPTTGLFCHPTGE